MRRGRADLKNSINRAGSAQIILRRMEAFKMPRFETKSREQERARGSREVFFFFFLSHKFCRSLEIRLADLIFIFPTESFFCRGERFARIGIDFDHGNLRNFVMDKKTRTDEYSGRSDDKSEKIERPRNHDRRR